MVGDRGHGRCQRAVVDMTKIAKGRSAIKMEESDEDDCRRTAVKVEEGCKMDSIPLKVVVDLVLTKRSPEYVETLLQKLKVEGITEPRYFFC